jgi:hypothetical protein
MAATLSLTGGGGHWAVFGWLSSFKTLLCHAFSSLSLLFLLLFFASLPMRVLVRHLENNGMIWHQRWPSIASHE